MRTLLVAIGLLLITATTASAQWFVPRPTTQQKPAAPVPPAAVVVKTATLLPGGLYPWAQPRWITVHGVTIVRAPATLFVPSVNPR
jgi:hypothetical protein